MSSQPKNNDENIITQRGISKTGLKNILKRTRINVSIPIIDVDAIDESDSIPSTDILDLRIKKNTEEIKEKRTHHNTGDILDSRKISESIPQYNNPLENVNLDNNKILLSNIEPKNSDKYDKYEKLDVRLQNNPTNIEAGVKCQRNTDSNKHKNVKVRTDAYIHITKLNDSENRLIHFIRQKKIHIDHIIKLINKEVNYKRDPKVTMEDDNIIHVEGDSNIMEVKKQEYPESIKKLLEYSRQNKSVLNSFFKKVTPPIPKNYPPPTETIVSVNSRTTENYTKNSNSTTRKTLQESNNQKTKDIIKSLSQIHSHESIKIQKVKRPVPPLLNISGYEKGTATSAKDIRGNSYLKYSKPLPPTVQAAHTMAKMSYTMKNDQLQYYTEAQRPKPPTAIQQDPFFYPHLTHQYNIQTKRMPNQTTQHILPNQEPNTVGSHQGMPFQMGTQKMNREQPNPIVNPGLSGSHYLNREMDYPYQQQNLAAQYQQPSPSIQQAYPNTQWQTYQQ